MAGFTGMSKDVGRQVDSLVLITLLYKGLELTLKSFFLYSSSAAVYSVFLSLHQTRRLSPSYFCCISSTRKSNTKPLTNATKFFIFFFCFQPRDWDSPFGVKVLGKGKLLVIPTPEAKGSHSLGRYPCVWVLYAAHLRDPQSGCLELRLRLVLDQAGYVSEYIYTVRSSASNITRAKPL